MFSLFKKKKIDMSKINAFCDWFILNHEEIKQSVINSNNDRMKMMMYLDLVEKELAKVYSDFYKGEIYFGYGPISKSNKWNLDLCHFNKKPLIKITTLIQERLSKELGETWIISISK